MSEYNSIKLPSRSKNICGQDFGRLTAVVPVAKQSHGVAWLCTCSCGTEHVALASSLLSGRTRSCGCLRSETVSRLKTKHGMSGTREYFVWSTMKARCANPNYPYYYRYGGRGIRVCDRWVDDFEAFQNDMGQRPTNKHTLERIDNDGDYSPENCTWATMKEQCNNTRRNIILSHDGMTLSLSEWSRKLNINYDTIRNRLRRGWSPDRALTEPVRGTSR